MRWLGAVLLFAGLCGGLVGSLAAAEDIPNPVPLPRPRPVTPPAWTEPHSFRQAAGPGFDSAAVTAEPSSCRLRLQAIAMGRGAGADLRALDDELAADDVRRSAGPMAEVVLAAVAPLRGPERLLDLGLRAGPYGDRFGAVPGGLSLAKLRAHPAGIDLGALAPRVPEMLRTPSGHIELAPAMVLADLARVRADLEREVPALVVIGRRQLRSNNSWMHNTARLVKGPVRCTLLIHPDDAAARAITDGASVRLSTERGAIELPVEVTDTMMPGVVSVPHGWGHGRAGVRLRVASTVAGASVNDVLDPARVDELSGTSALSGQPVEVTAR
jgi:hypothetical protein